jgi:7-cyano-7-deazaguanine synthase
MPAITPPPARDSVPDGNPIAVLTSGGLDSAILVAHLARTHPASPIHPIYLQSGLAWEAIELRWLERYLEALRLTGLKLEELVVLQQPTRDLYGNHWSITGQRVPDRSTPDEAVYLPGRNALLSLKALLWCHLHQVSALALGVLASNPFPDATPAFFQSFAAAVGQAVNDASLRIVTPLDTLHKIDVLQLGHGLPLELSFSCIQPQGELHCGRCNKCFERQQAFRQAGMADPTRYAG